MLQGRGAGLTTPEIVNLKSVKEVNMAGRMFRMATLIGLAWIVSTTAAPAQTQNVQLGGRVRDAAGLPLPGVTITLTEPTTGYTRFGVSAINGAYLLSNLRPGTYDVRVEITGFQTLIQTGLILRSGAAITLDWNLEVAGVAEVVTVTGEAPLVELTSNRIGGTLSTREIDEIPSNFRNFTALTQLVPGMTPIPSQSTFEGGGVVANGAVGANNMFLIDGGYNNDDRLGSGPGAQVRVVLDAVSEFQVLASQYSAEYGGAAGAVMNMITRSGTNAFSGRVYSYYRNDSLYSRSSFLAAGESKPEERTLQAGFGIGGPIIQDRAHFYFNYERDEEEIGGFKKFPAEGAPLAQDFVGFFTVDANNYFGKVDVQLNPQNFVTGRWVLETAPALGEGFNTNSALLDAREFESDFDTSLALSWTSIMGRAANVFRFTRIGEQLGSGSKAFFDDSVNFVGFQGNQFGIGSANEHPGYDAGPGGTGTNTRIRTYDFANTFSYFLPQGQGDHEFKVGTSFSLNRALPRTRVDSGTFVFDTDFPYDPAVPATFPVEFEIQVGDPALPGFDTNAKDWRASFFAQDRWRVNDRLTLNLGFRFDYQDAVPNSGDDFSPRLGFAYDPIGDGRTVFRGGFGRFTQWTRIAVNVDLAQRALVTSFPTVAVSDPLSPILQPDMTTDSDGNPGVAVLSAAGQAEVERLRDALLAGQTFSTEPRFDSEDRAMPYQWAWNLGATRELMPDLALTVDYVANVSRDQIGRIDINEPVGGVRPGVDVFDPNGILVPAAARGTSFRRVFQYQTRSELDGDYKSLQVGVIKRFSNRFSMRHAYTLQEAHRVGIGTERTVWLDNDIRADDGRFQFNRTHVLSMSGTWDVWEGLILAGILSASSGAPQNEVTGVDGNGDNVRNDRPIQGIDDATLPIVSEVDSQGRAVPFGIDGPNFVELNLSVRYNFDLANRGTLGLYWDMYNVTNRTNLNLPNGNRSSGNFLTSTSALLPRQMQLGARFSF